MQYLHLLILLASMRVKIVRRLIRPVTRWQCPVKEVPRDEVLIWIEMLANNVSHECATMFARHYFGPRDAAI